MKTISLFLVLFLVSAFVDAQTIYSKAFGDPKANPVIFLHGGPGYNCAGFEVTTAQKLADNGFYVIVYDRRGEGRSKDTKAAYNFKETFDDINALYKTYKIKKANIMGHSFGGMVATLFAEKYPKKVKSVILVGAPVCLQETFRTIIKTVKVIYESKQDTVSLSYIRMLEKMDTTSMQYASYCFYHAMGNGFYSTKTPTDDAKKIRGILGSSDLLPLVKEMTYEAPQGFSDNEKYTTQDLTDNIKNQIGRASCRERV